jgi:hypothetical protein
MGLDMYLTKKTYVRQWDHRAPEERWEVTVTKGGKPFDGIDTTKISYIEEEVAYWRKANHIHSWFVKNLQNGVDNCGEYHVTDALLEELMRACIAVKADNSLAESLLPTESGFFFGGTEYDEWYYKSIDYTISILEEVLSDMGNTNADYYYSSSW